MSFDIRIPGRDFIRGSNGDADRPETVGRTWADILHADRRILVLSVAVIVVLILIIVYKPDFSGVSVWYSENKLAIHAFLGAFVVMFFIGRFITLRLIQVLTVDYLVLDFVNMRGSVYRIPVPLLSTFQVSGGNNLQFSWRDGHVFKLARNVDIENGIIETAWPHEISIEQAAFTLSDLQAREKDYHDAKIENLLLRRCPMVLAADLAKDANDRLASELSDLLQLGSLDVDSYLAGLDPLHRKKLLDDVSESVARDSENAPEVHE